MGRKRKSLVGKSPFKLRRRKLADGRISLFLDRSVDGGHEYEFLQLYLLPETSSTAKRQNARTLPGGGRNLASENRSPVECKSRDGTCRFRYGDAPFGLASDLL